jgi:hypothetical protein
MIERRGFLGLLSGLIGGGLIPKRLLGAADPRLDWEAVRFTNKITPVNVFSLQRLADEALIMVEAHTADMSRVKLKESAMSDGFRIGQEISNRVPRGRFVGAPKKTVFQENRLRFSDTISSSVCFKKSDLELPLKEFQDMHLNKIADHLSFYINNGTTPECPFALVSPKPEDLMIWGNTKPESVVSAKGYGMSLRMALCPVHSWDYDEKGNIVNQKETENVMLHISQMLASVVTISSTLTGADRAYA